MPTPNPLDPSTSTQDTEAQVASSAPDAEQSVESSATTHTPGDNKPASLLELVTSVVEKTETAQEAPPATDKAADSANPDAAPSDPKQANPPPSGEKDAKGEEAPADEKDGKTAEDTRFDKHPRFQELIREKNHLKSEVETFRTDAEQFRSIAGFMAENELSADEVDEGFAIMAAMKRNPMEALRLLTPKIQSIQRAAGVILPDELAEKVEGGEMSEEAAHELARTRAQLANQERIRQSEQARFQQAQLAQQAQTAQTQIAGAIDQWETRIAGSDPDYAAKKAIVFDKIRLAHLQTPARNPQEALAIAEQAYREASDLVKGFAPRRPEVKLPTTQQTVSTVKAVPKSLADVVRAAVA